MNMENTLTVEQVKQELNIKELPDGVDLDILNDMPDVVKIRYVGINLHKN